MACKVVFSDRFKCVSAVALITITSIYLILMGLLFYFGYMKVKDRQLSSNGYLPEYSLNFESFSSYLFISCILGAVVFLFSLIAVQMKKPYTALAYLIIAVGSGVLLL
jgi:hypothetical protein